VKLNWASVPLSFAPERSISETVPVESQAMLVQLQRLLRLARDHELRGDRGERGERLFFHLRRASACVAGDAVICNESVESKRRWRKRRWGGFAAMPAFRLLSNYQTASRQSVSLYIYTQWKQSMGSSSCILTACFASSYYFVICLALHSNVQLWWWEHQHFPSYFSQYWFDNVHTKQYWLFIVHIENDMYMHGHS
jgi:hypothetical protein